ncbi:nitrite and sulphite reductase 4Fe-4S region [Methanococcus aeolicus Nankai-3]|uniref:Nitrite and sulphite reductase 4Fe-4S region n=1 Tax=Methanococcus aeolicus (strain ATCC BAA-1280 / DSM 17508 / OCM 812 / Nankai-3) TaxID=419665 RepID=A6UV39_META3|nr:Coenzyme F420 hydrogenase/dehydrogenase, beta subunit C-terminal domain [Methanococcus aeolicus]ABR56361.1 nitrite and sulphite reductase 4Fe-4S region [Methanococcus aeolicus Nankai-3]
MYEWKLNDIVDNGLCAKCGTCVVVCPNNILEFEEVPKLTEECLRKGYGMCHDVCPRVSSGKYQISIRENFKEEHYYGKGDIEGQDGGVVSTFLKHLLENKKIDGAIVVGDECWKPVSLIVQNPEDIEKSAKSKYAVSTLEALREAGEMGIEKVAVVGLPCQIAGLRKLQYFPYLAKYDGELGKNGKLAKLPKIEYLIGLLCTEKFEYDKLKEALAKNDIKIEDVKKFDIKKGKLIIITEDEEYKIPLKDIEMNAGCKMCRDFDAEMADVSVGCVGSPDGYSTVTIRTEKGEEIKNAVELNEGVELAPIEKLKELKLNRFKKELERRKENNEKISFYWLADYAGVGKRADNDYFIRVRAKPAGWYSLDEVKEIVKITEKYDGKIKMTNRGGFEIHHITPFYAEDMALELAEKDLITGSEGPLVRATLACPGEGNCGSGLINTTELCSIIEDNFIEHPAPYKFKIAISGCPNKCVRPQIHEIGIAGVKFPITNEENCNGCGRCADICKVEAIDIRGDTSYTNYNICIGCGKCIKGCPNEGRDMKEEGFMVFVGGKSGREVIEGISMKLMSIEEIVNLIDKVLIVYHKYAQKPQRERLGAVMARVGKGKFLEEVKELMEKE